MIEIKVDDGGTRIDKYLADRLEYSRSEISESIKEGLIEVNGRQVKSSYKLADGDLIVGRVEIKEPDLSPVKMDLDIVYEDEYMLAVNKQYGLTAHPSISSKDPSLVNGLLASDRPLSNLAGKDRPGIVHRLDKDTTGVMVIAKDNKTHQALSDLFKERKIKKTYLALVHGRINQDGSVDLPIGRDPNNRTRMAVNQLEGRKALTHYKPLDVKGNYSLVELDLITGRTHQIRVHLAHIGHPILGDRVYGRKKEGVRADHQMLHAWKLNFIHPYKKLDLEIQAGFDQSFIDCLNKLGLGKDI